MNKNSKLSDDIYYIEKSVKSQKSKHTRNIIEQTAWINYNNDMQQH